MTENLKKLSCRILLNCKLIENTYETNTGRFINLQPYGGWTFFWLFREYNDEGGKIMLKNFINIRNIGKHA